MGETRCSSHSGGDSLLEDFKLKWIFLRVWECCVFQTLIDCFSIAVVNKKHMFRLQQAKSNLEDGTGQQSRSRILKVWYFFCAVIMLACVSCGFVSALPCWLLRSKGFTFRRSLKHSRHLLTRFTAVKGVPLHVYSWLLHLHGHAL